jgi:rod shape-determining protein MreD
MSRFLRKAVIAALIVALLLFQLPLTRYAPWLSMLDLPLVCVLYLTIFKESLFWTVLAGTGVGFLQDSMSLGALGMNGFTIISIGFLVYLANSVFAIDRLTTRWAMLFLSSTMALLLSFLLRVLFLNRDEMIDVRLLLLSGVLNACIGMFIFYLLDRVTKPVKD